MKTPPASCSASRNAGGRRVRMSSTVRMIKPSLTSGANAAIRVRRQPFSKVCEMR